MKKLVLLVVCCLYIPGMFAKVAFLQLPELVTLRQAANYKQFKFEDNELQNNEEIEDELNSRIDDIITNEELEELRDAASVLDEYDVYEGIYDPFSNVTRKKRSVGPNLATYLIGIVDNLEKMIQSNNKVLQGNYYTKAVNMLDNYIQSVKNTKKKGERNALQIFKQDQFNLLLVNCGGWVWYPIKRMKKILTCKNGYIRFEERFQKKVRMCDDFVCKRVRL